MGGVSVSRADHPRRSALQAQRGGKNTYDKKGFFAGLTVRAHETTPRIVRSWNSVVAHEIVEFSQLADRERNGDPRQ